MEIDSATLEQALETLGQLLKDRGHSYELIAIGGGSLLLLGHISRSTKDLDLIARIETGKLVSAKPLPSELFRAVQDVGSALELTKDWLNPGPTSLLDTGLPEGFENRLHTRHFGSLTIHLAGRLDQICFKLYAAVDQGPHSKHFHDLKLLKPVSDELQMAKKWCLTQDVSEEFASELNKTILALSKTHETS